MIVSLFNRACTALADLVMSPWSFESPWPGLIAASLLASAILLPVFALCSNPRKLRQSRGRLFARAMEPLLFQHDLRVSFSAFGRILAANGAYLLTLLRPLLVGLIPMSVAFLQLAGWFERRPFREGEPAVVVVQLDPRSPVLKTNISLTGSGIGPSPLSVRVPSRNEIAFRVMPDKAGEHRLKFQVGSAVEEKLLVVGRRLKRVTQERVQAGTFRELASPGEPPLAVKSPIDRIEVKYPARELEFRDTPVPWWLAAIVLMMGFGLLLGKVFRIPIA